MNAIDPISLTQQLIQRPSITPIDAGALDLVEDALKGLGFETHRLRFEEPGADPVDNLYARRGAMGPNFCFAGHTDVVPTGPVERWSAPPFAGLIRDGELWGRGAADMKGAIAAFIAAAARFIDDGGLSGSISLLITGDEEGPAINGTRKALAWLANRGERIDHCIVGEPSSAAVLGDVIKVGRRGSINCWLTVAGAQGHVAYPDRARNPIHDLTDFLQALLSDPIDTGYTDFPPTSLQVTDVRVGNEASNVIPGEATARFNIRFNPNWTGETMEAWIRARLDDVAARTGARYGLKTIVSGEAFLTTDADFIGLVSNAVAAVTGRRPASSTTGGTSDARFIRAYAPVAELGLVGTTIHQIDERTPTQDIHALSGIYERLLRDYFTRCGGGR